MIHMGQELATTDPTVGVCIIDIVVKYTVFRWYSLFTVEEGEENVSSRGLLRGGMTRDKV